MNYIVVGGGILGASTFYHLAKSGAQVLLIDRKDQGQATDAAAGIVCPWLSQRRNKAWYRLAKSGASYYPTIINQLEMDGQYNTGYKKVGALSIHTDEEKLAKMENRALKRREDAPEIGNITRLSSKETKTLFPPLSEKYSAVYVSGAARVNGRALRTSLINAAVKQGATYINGDATICKKNKRIIGVKVNGTIIEAEKVIVTAGAWSRSIFQALDIHFTITSQKAQIVHLEIPDKETSHWPVVMPPNDQYILSFEQGRIVVGATHENDVGFDQRITAGGLYEIFEKALTVAPGLTNCTFLETRVGFRPFTPGFLPIIGSLPQFPELLIANGLGSSGLTVGPFLGSELAKLALDRPTTIDLNDYNVSNAIQY